MRLRLICSIILLFGFYQLSAQNVGSDSAFRVPAVRNFYIGAGTGLNGPSGLAGIFVNYRLYKFVHLNAGTGLSLWGFRHSIGAEIDANPVKGGGVGIGYSYSTGFDSINLSISNGRSSTERVMQLYPTKTINLTFHYKLLIFKRHYIQFYTGIASKIGTRVAGQYRILEGDPLSQDDKDVLNVMVPGGFMLGANLMLAL
jgi:hypothetical protein